MMQLPLQITFRNVPSSEAIDAKIRQKTDKLNQLYSRLMGCRVAIEAPHRHHQGNLYHIRIDLTVPGGELVVNRTPPEHQAHEDIYVAIRDAFDDAKRELQDYARRQRGDVKTHETPQPQGRVAKLFPDEGYGFIETADGYEVYFHQHSVLDNAFDELELGSEVSFVEEEGERGPQASTVRLMGKYSEIPPAKRNFTL
jgi:cold shock CspA family protein/ribosome-associated translation inhibitor RaiA